MKKGFFRVEVIGDLPKEEAREFFQSSVLPSFGLSLQLSDEQWTSVYEVRGDLIFACRNLVACLVVILPVPLKHYGAGRRRKPRAAHQRCQRFQRRLAAK